MAIDNILLNYSLFWFFFYNSCWQSTCSLTYKSNCTRTIAANRQKKKMKSMKKYINIYAPPIRKNFNFQKIKKSTDKKLVADKQWEFNKNIRLSEIWSPVTSNQTPLLRIARFVFSQIRYLKLNHLLLAAMQLRSWDVYARVPPPSTYTPL